MALKPTKVLVVEDDTDDFLILKTMLLSIQPGRFELERVSSYEDALEKIAGNLHDVCLLDYRLKGKNGIDFLRETHERGYATPILLLTGLADYQVDLEAMRLGASDFIHKSRIDGPLLERSIRYAIERKKAEELLRHREEFFRAVIDNALDGVAIADVKGQIRYLSPPVERILGYTVAGRLGTDIFSLFHPEDVPRFREIFRKVSGTPGVETAEFLAHHQNGSWRILEATVQSHYFTNPDFLGVVLNYRDITDRKGAQESMARLATIVEHSNDAIVASDLKGVITHWNRGAEMLYGYTEKEALGQPVTMLLTERNQDENQHHIELIKQGGAIQHLESVRRRKGGELVDVDISVSPYKDANGKIVGLSAIVRDITERKRSQEAVSRLASVVETSNDAIYTLNLEGRILSWNPGAGRIYGYSEAEIKGKTLSDLTVPSRRGEIPQLLEKARRGNAPADLVTVHGAKQGGEILLSLSLSPLRDDQGRVTQVSVIARDITESERVKAIQETLRNERDQLLERLQLQMEHMPIACILTDPHFHFTYWNPAAESMFGYSYQEAEGHHLQGLVAGPESWEKLQEVFQEAAGGKGGSRTVDVENLRKDGKTIVCEWYNTPLHDGEGNFLGIMSMALDVTERSKAEEVRSQLAAILQQTADAVIGTDLEGLVFGWNRGAEALLGYPLAEISGRPVAELVPESHRKEMEKLFRAVLTGEPLPNREMVWTGKNGGLIDVSVTLSTIRDAKGKVTGVSAIARDITDRKKAEESLRRHEEQMRLAQKMDAIGRLAGGVAHDFNNLLSVIGGNTEFLLGSMEEKDPHREELEEIQKAVKRGAELTRQLLVFGQKQVSQPQPVNLNDLSAEMNKMLKRLIDATIDLAIIQDKDLKHILADPGQMQQIILNLVLNARDAMPKGGHLIVETKHVEAARLAEEERSGLPRGDYARLSVTDTGSGMTPEVQKHIFEPFFTTKAGKGTGLGLATVYGLVHQWSGHIFVHSTPGMGSTFTLYFPALHGVEIAAPKQRQIALIPQGSETVLVAEDEEPVRKILVRTLEKFGYHVLESQNGIEALQKAWAYREQIHLLLTDTVMPKMNGKELADELKKTRPKTKVIFISGYPKEILSQQGVLDPGIHLIQKPFDLEAMVMEVRKMLDEK